MGNITCGNCIELVVQIPDNAVDFVFTDPPWNVGKDYGGWNDSMPEAEYLQFMADVIAQCNRISKNGLAIFVGSKIVRPIWNMIPDARCIIIRKGAISTPTPDYYYRQWCALLVTARPLERCYDLWEDIRMTGEGYYFREERFPHPGQTPLALTNRVLQYFTKEYDLILDPFMGTATTAVACVNMNRHYVGFELNIEYIKIGESRILAAVKDKESQPELF